MDFTLRQCKEQIPVADYSNLNPYECIQFVQSLWRRLVESKLLYDNPILQYMLMERLSPHAVIVKHKFHLKHLVWIAQKLKTTLRKRMIHPGESVGTNSSQNMGEVFTQMALKTPHFSTFQSVVAGSQRLGQLVNGQFKHPQMTLVLTPEVHSQAKAEVIATEFVISFMKDVITEYPTYIVDSENVYVTFTIDTQECIRRVITGREMSLALARRLKIGLDQVQVPFMDEIIHCETFTLMVTVSTDDYPTEREYCNMLANLTYRTVIHGMGGFRGKYNKVAKKDVEPIVFAIVNQIDIRDYDRTEKRWCITTLGSNLIRALTHPKVDETRSTSNDMYEVWEVLGIHAARKLLEQEFLKVISGKTDRRHIKLIVRAITRYGIKGMVYNQLVKHIPPTQRATFERVIQQLNTSAGRGEKDTGATIAGATHMGNL